MSVSHTTSSPNGLAELNTHYWNSIGCPKMQRVDWNDVGGLDEVKRKLSEALESRKTLNKELSSYVSSGCLFYGPPGTGKTLLAKAVASNFGYRFLSVKGPELFNMYIGQSEMNIRELFQRARESAPCIIFFDEFDSLGSKRGGQASSVTGRVVSQLLVEMDGVDSNRGIYVIAATNRPDMIDPSFLRPGRLETTLYVGVYASYSDKSSVMTALTRRFKLKNPFSMDKVVNALPEKVTGADMYSVCAMAWLAAARRCMASLHRTELVQNRKETEQLERETEVLVSEEDFTAALDNFIPSISPEAMNFYEEFHRKMSS